LGCSSVKGCRRVPNPAAKIIPFILGLFIFPFLPH
jgi:hypothetical protein